MRLALPVVHPRFFQQVLLKRGYALEPQTIGRMLELGIRSIWVDYPGLDFLDRMLPTELLHSQGKLVHEIAAGFEKAQSQSVARLPFDTYRQSIADLVAQLIGNPQAAVFLGDLSEAAGEDLMRHSSTATYLSLLIGLKLEGYIVRQRRHVDPGRAKDVIHLGVGAMLHDLGIAWLSDKVRERHRASGDESDPEWREHTMLGFEAVRGHVEPSAATVVLNHHQRHDGTGYAGKAVPVLHGSRVHVFARIVGLAEQFDRMRYPLNLPAQPTVWVLGALLHRNLFVKFDSEVVRALFLVVPPYPPGSMVKLSDGRSAVVVEHVPYDPCRPVVQLLPDLSLIAEGRAGGAEEGVPAAQTIALAEAPRSLCIAEADGHDVRELNFAAPRLMAELVAEAG